MLKTFSGYALAGLVGLAAPVVALWIARTAPAGADSVWPAYLMIGGLTVLAALVARLMPARWLSIAIIMAAPLCLLAILMFWALTEAASGGYYWVWIGLGAGGVAATFTGARIGARSKRA